MVVVGRGVGVGSGTSAVLECPVVLSPSLFVLSAGLFLGSSVGSSESSSVSSESVVDSEELESASSALAIPGSAGSSPKNPASASYARACAIVKLAANRVEIVEVSELELMKTKTIRTARKRPLVDRYNPERPVKNELINPLS